ncbi:eva-1 homolog Bb isoform X2 [Rhinichthys klamathensis goyatoka]|uniref:eva-1 homolog Bb isoform X2 n=1 Tax=Rhinichthys klamathensis goyatoka TaxID=3034132 RepID=UPI0024B5FE23|nr:eva-1 homolog Bb isoform X2 [Rhinichthys klamathensis goyatoka]
MNPIRKDMELLSNSMATYAHIKGLLLALVLLMLGITCRSHSKTKTPSTPDKRRLKESSEDEEDKEEEDSEAGDDEDLEVPVLTVSPLSDQTQLNSMNVFASAEELERARRLEERERIVREIWRNGQPDILVIGTGTLGRVHYH